MVRGDVYEAFVTSAAYRAGRRQKARVVSHLCGNYLRAEGVVADLGAGTGLIKRVLEEEFGRPIVGFELDTAFVRERGRMVLADVLRLPLADGSLSFAIVNHLYEHVRDQAGLFSELARVLGPGGCAYVSAGSRFALIEPHYRLPLLSWLPVRWAAAYVRLSGRGSGYEGIRFVSYRVLSRTMLAAGLRIHDETERAIEELISTTWGVRWARVWSCVRLVPRPLRALLLRALSPQWFFVLEKPAGRLPSDG